MRLTHFFLILLLIPFSLLAQDWKTFDDTSVAFTAKYPSTWVNKIKDGKRVFLHPQGKMIKTFFMRM